MFSGLGILLLISYGSKKGKYRSLRANLTSERVAKIETLSYSYKSSVDLKSSHLCINQNLDFMLRLQDLYAHLS